MEKCALETGDRIFVRFHDCSCLCINVVRTCDSKQQRMRRRHRHTSSSQWTSSAFKAYIHFGSCIWAPVIEICADILHVSQFTISLAGFTLYLSLTVCAYLSLSHVFRWIFSRVSRYYHPNKYRFCSLVFNVTATHLRGYCVRICTATTQVKSFVENTSTLVARLLACSPSLLVLRRRKECEKVFVQSQAYVFVGRNQKRVTRCAFVA